MSGSPYSVARIVWAVGTHLLDKDERDNDEIHHVFPSGKYLKRSWVSLPDDSEGLHVELGNKRPIVGEQLDDISNQSGTENKKL